MDSISHASMGVGISILALNTGMVDSEYSAITYTAVIVASIIPDIDVVTKIGGNKSYINHHRGFTHSVIMFFVLTAILNLIANLFLPNSDNNVLLGWIGLAVAMHIITDIFNNYGVKLLWPFKDRWLSINATYTIDYVILSLHIIGIILYFLFNLDGQILFSTILIITITYLLVLATRRQLRILYIRRQFDKEVKHIYFASKSSPHQWKFVIEATNGYYYIGELHGNKMRILGKQRKHLKIDNDVYNIIKDDKNLIIFKKFSKVYNWSVKKRKHLTEVRVKDLTYYTKINKKYVYLFNCVIYINNETKKIENTYVGFTTGDESLYKMVKHPINAVTLFRKIFRRKGDIKG